MVNMNFLEVLVDPPEAEIDIVAVHGLNPFSRESNAKSTWTADSEDGKHFWLQDEDFLPSSIPKARILLCGYNSSVALASSNAAINDHATNLLIFLRDRRKDCSNRPLIFICHSLGGLLIKRTLVVAFSNGVSEDKVLYESTYGIVFFATPHRGGEHVKFGKILGSIVRAVFGNLRGDVLEALEKNDFYSSQNRSDFLPRTRDFKFISFFETKPTGRVSIVKKGNAILGLPPDQETVFGVDGDHLSICRFSDPNGSDFRIVANLIAQMCAKATEQRRIAGTPPTNHTVQVRTPAPAPERPSRRNSHQSEVDIVFPMMENAIYATDFGHGGPSSSFFTKNEIAMKEWFLPTFLKSFVHYDYTSAFDEVNVGRYANSGDWFFATDEFRWWADGPSSKILWVKADPGVGKSTLLTHVVETLQTRPGSEKSTVLYSFCHHQSNCTASMVLSITIHQMLIHFPTLQAFAFETDTKESLERSNPWSIRKGKYRSPFIMWRLLRRLVKESGVEKVFLVIDALDQCQKDSQDILVSKLLSSLFSNPHAFIPGLKLLISSRPEDQFLIARSRFVARYPSSSRQMDLQDHDRSIGEDIDNYVAGEAARLAQLRGQSQHVILGHIPRLGSRTFLPLVYFFKRLENGDDLKAAAAGVSSDLRVLYKSLITRVPEAVRIQASPLMAFLAYSYRALTLPELALASRIVELGSTGESTDSKSESLRLEDHIIALRACLRKYSPLIKIKEDDSVVCFHDSARVFIFSKVLGDLGCSDASPTQSHRRLALACLRTISMNSSIPLSTSQRASDCSEKFQVVSNHVFLKYSFQYWHRHFAEAVESPDHPTTNGVDSELLNAVQGLVNLWKRPSTLGFRSVMLSLMGIEESIGSELEVLSPLEILSAFGLTFFLRIYLEQVLYTSRSVPKAARNALRLAVKGGHEAAVDLLVEHFGISSLDNAEFRTIIADSAWSGRPNIVSTVLRLRKPRTLELVQAIVAAFVRGERETLEALTQDQSIFLYKDHFGMTALHVLYASWGWSDSIDSGILIAISYYLVNHGVGVTVVDNMGYTALHYACWNPQLCRKEIIEALIRLGASPHTRSRGGLTPLHFAARYSKDVDAIQTLLDVATNTLLGQASRGGNTAMHWAVQRHEVAWYDSSKEILSILLHRGADINAPNARGMTPRQICERFTSDLLQEVYTGLDGVTLIAIEPPPPDVDNEWLWSEWADMGTDSSIERRRVVRLLLAERTEDEAVGRYSFAVTDTFKAPVDSGAEVTVPPARQFRVILVAKRASQSAKKSFMRLLRREQN